jgi:DNA-directed RNA polymerase specialized sigma24 family protein
LDSNDFDDRISRIDTMWTVVLGAHAAAAEAVGQAQVKLLQRYSKAIYRYLLGALRDADAADELFQEFALNFVRGRFRGADPAKGRFRDYIKTSLFHLIGSYRKRRLRQPLQADSAILAGAAAPEEAGQADEEFRKSWRDELLARAWSSLQRLEQEQGGYLYTMLHFRSKHPEIDSARMAAALGEELGRPLTAASVRQTIHRARAKFAELLLDEVARTLPGEDADALEQEVIDLGLHAYCADTLRRRKGKPDAP